MYASRHPEVGFLAIFGDASSSSSWHYLEKPKCVHLQFWGKSLINTPQHELADRSLMKVFHVAGVIRNLPAPLLENITPTEGPAEWHTPHLPQHNQTASDHDRSTLC